MMYGGWKRSVSETLFYARVVFPLTGDGELTFSCCSLLSMNFLASLYLHGNAFTGKIPNGLFELSTLIDLRLSDNRLTGGVSAGFDELTRLGKCLWRAILPLAVAIATVL
jgi:hypothetical protein